MTPEELDEARAKEAKRLWSSNDPTIPDIATVAARLARENWTPPEPEPVDPDILAFREWLTTIYASPSKRILAHRGHYDNDPDAKAYIAGARMAREQERERARWLVEYVRGYACPESEGADILAKYEGGEQ